MLAQRDRRDSVERLAGTRFSQAGINASALADGNSNHKLRCRSLLIGLP